MIKRLRSEMRYQEKNYIYECLEMYRWDKPSTASALGIGLSSLYRKIKELNMKNKRTASQVGKMSRRKGKSFERWVAHYFTQWTGLKWETTRNSGRTDLKGDIYCPSRLDLNLIVECKHRKEYSTVAMVRGNKSILSLIKKYSDKMLIIKNDTDIWVLYDYFLSSLFSVGGLTDVIRSRRHNWVKLKSLHNTKIDGVIFNAQQRMDSVGEEGEG